MKKYFHTKIEWVKNPDGSLGWVWNPITGCLNGCEYCYARRLANTRLKDRYLANKNVAPFIPNEKKKAPYLYDRDPFYPRFWESRIQELAKRNDLKPRGIFVCDMSDLFGIGIPDNWQWNVFEVIKHNPQHRFYLLTKQPQNLIKFSPFPPNCWLGVSVTTKEQLRPAIWGLSEVQCNKRFLSFEPLLENVLDQVLPAEWDDAINWVIIGAQTKPTVFPKIEWVQEIVEACDKVGVPVFLKNNLKPLIESSGFLNAGWAAREWVQCKYPILRQEMPCK